MTIFTKHITKNLLKNYLYTLISLLLFYLIIDIFSHLDEYIRSHVSINLVSQYYLYFAPVVAVQLSPLALLTVIIGQLNTMNRHREIMALLASGISPVSIIRPVLTASLCISLLCLVIGEFALPLSASKAYQLKREHIRSRRERIIWNNVLFCSASGRIYYLIGEYNKQTKQMRRVQISEYTKEGQESVSIWAKRGQVNQGHWILEDGVMRKYGPSGELLKEEKFKTLKLKVDQDPADYLLSQKKPEELSIRELVRRIKKMQSSGLVPRQESVTLHRKVASPLANLIFAIIGLGFGLKPHRMPNIASFGIAFLIAVIYYILTNIFSALGDLALPPAIAGWLSSVLFLLCGLILMHRTLRFP